MADLTPEDLDLDAIADELRCHVTPNRYALLALVAAARDRDRLAGLIKNDTSAIVSLTADRDRLAEQLAIAVEALDVYLADDGNDTIPPVTAGRALARIAALDPKEADRG